MRLPPTMRGRIIFALYGLNAALLLLGLAFGKRDAQGRNRIPRPVRMLSSALVLVCALLGAARRDRATRLIAAGMGCGFAGDLVMAQVIALPEHVILGMLTFGAGHVLYIRAFVRQARMLALRSTRMRWSALAAAWAVALVGWRLLVRNPAIGPKLNYGALAYALLLCSMSGMAGELAARDPRYRPAALGGTLFFASDMLLARELFRGAHFPQSGDAIWLTYIAGQALIVSSFDHES